MLGKKKKAEKSQVESQAVPEEKKKDARKSVPEKKKETLPVVADKVPRKGRKILKLIVILLLITLIVILIVQNLQITDVVLLSIHIPLPVIAIILIFTLIGYVLGSLTFSLIFRRPRKKEDKPESETEDK